VPDQKRPGLSRNLVSQIGVTIAIVGLLNLLFLIYIEMSGDHSNPYLGILTWIVAPAILIFGLALFLLGMGLERRRRRLRGAEDVPEFPRIDLNDNHTRRVAIFTAVGLILFVTVSVVGSYQAYHYTETDAFCGTMCHSVMHPEYTAYKLSPHARVGCVGCHVGSGATWFVKSKLSGSYQVYSVLANKYPKPIQTPVHSLRPARDTCEQCHWPEKFFGAQLKEFDHFAYDEENTPRHVRMLIKTGGGSPSTGRVSGIHWHMNISNEITYIATDRQRQKIPWVEMKNRQTGEITRFVSKEEPLTDAQIATLPRRTIDCVDCHNRPTHIYMSPDRAVDQAIRAGRLDRSLPFLKAQAVAVLAKEYQSTAEATRTIRAEFPAFYAKEHPDVYGTKRASIDRATAALEQIFKSTRFPEMKTDWRTHPDNIGHMMTQGCFRCHDDKHVSSDGKRISKECSVCHDVINENNANTQFEHPVDLGDMREVNCSDCHTGSGM
jgi:hypothetical protein